MLNTSDSNGQSVFSIVETNPFKQLTHLSLRFFPGDDAAIKAYLAARLAQVGASRRALSTSLKQTSEELQVTQTSEAKLQQQLSALGYEAESTLSQEKMKFADDLDAQRRAAATALKEREGELNAKIDALVERYEKEVSGDCTEGSPIRELTATFVGGSSKHSRQQRRRATCRCKI